MTGIDSDELAAAIQTLASAIAAAVVRELRQPGEDQWVSQSESPLGSRLHCRAVRRRIDAGDSGAAIVRRNHLLSRQALAAELSKRPTPRRKSASKPASSDDFDSLGAELRAAGANV